MSQAPTKTLRRLLIEQFLIVVLAAAVVAGALVAFWRLPMVRDQTQAEQIRAVTLSMAQIDVMLDTVESIGEAFGQVLLETHTGTDAQSMAQLVTYAADHSGLVSASYVLDQNMKVAVLAKTSAKENRPDAFIGTDLSRLSAVSLARQTGKPSWSDQYNSPLQSKPVVALVVPAGSQMLVLELQVEQLVKLIQKSQSVDGLLVLVTDRRGEVIVAADPKLQLTRRNLGSLAVIRAALDARPTFDAFEIDQVAYSGRAQQMNRMGWVVLAAYPQTYTDQTKVAAIGIALVTLLLSLAAGVALFSGLSLRLQRQLQHMVTYAEQVAHGDYRPLGVAAGTLEVHALNLSLQHMAEKIENRELQLSAIVNNAPHLAIQWFDIQGRVMDWNPGSEQLLGWTKAQALGKNLADLIYTPAQHQQFLGILQTIDTTGKAFGPFEDTVTNRSGQTLNILSTTFAIPSDDATRRFVCMDVDITAIKRHEHALRLSEQRFNLLFNASPVAVAVIERQATGDICTAVNQAFVDLTGRDPAGILPAEMAKSGLFDSVQSLKGKLSMLGADKPQVALTGDISMPDGRVRSIEGLAGWVRSTPHDLVIVAAHDVTERLQLQDELKAINAELELRVELRTQGLRQANQELKTTLQMLKQTQSHLVHSEKLAALGALVAGVAHELNTPIGNGLMVVSTLAQRLKEFEVKLAHGLKRSDMVEFVQHIQTTSDIATRNLIKASELINGFKRVAVDQTSEQRRKFDLAEVVHEILLTLRPSMKHTPIEVVVNVPSIDLDSYPGPLGQVISNLVQNAVVHAFEGVPQGVITISASLRDDQVDIEISDNGKGIPMEDANRIFDPFFTTKLGQGGSGLGLHIVHNLVFGMLGGAIKLRAKRLPGACFVITLPVLAPLQSAEGVLSAFSV